MFHHFKSPIVMLPPVIFLLTITCAIDFTLLFKMDFAYDAEVG